MRLFQYNQHICRGRFPVSNAYCKDFVVRNINTIFGLSENIMAYQLLLSKETLNKILQYKQNLEKGLATPGKFFLEELSKQEKSISEMDITTFTQLLIQSKKPQVFAESQVYHDGTDWTLEEESILGDVSVNMPVTMYNDGGHGSSFRNHPKPISGYLAYVPGALLASGSGPTSDMKEVLDNGKLNQDKLNALYERRLLPQLIHFNELARQNEKQAAITIPGIGTGCFSGAYYDVIKPYVRNALIHILEKHKDSLPYIDIIHYDPYMGDEPAEKKIGHMSFRVSPSGVVRGTTGQLDYPLGSNPDTHILVSIVAWDHFSWPGNDYWGGARQTDDGVKAASTDTMGQVTGATGVYDKKWGRYMPPESFTKDRKGMSDWGDYVRENGIVFNGPVLALDKSGKLDTLENVASRSKAKVDTTTTISELVRGMFSLFSPSTTTEPSPTIKEEESKKSSPQ
ncbi:Dot/Icm T4SS effector MavL [Legionella pneumophila serogroup 10]